MEENMRDAAFAANIPRPWTGAVAGYLNSKTGDPFHRWSREDWDSFGPNRKLPIFVQSNPSPLTAVDDAWAVLGALEELGVPAGKGIRTALDLETAVSSRYVHAYGSILHWAGFRIWVYGSASTVFQNPVMDGYWVADYRDIGPFQFGHADVRATQYTDNPPGKKFDSSFVRNWVYSDAEHWWI